MLLNLTGCYLSYRYFWLWFRRKPFRAHNWVHRANQQNTKTWHHFYLPEGNSRQTHRLDFLPQLGIGAGKGFGNRVQVVDGQAVREKHASCGTAALESDKSWMPFLRNQGRLPGVGAKALPLGRVERGSTILNPPLNMDKRSWTSLLSLSDGTWTWPTHFYLSECSIKGG